MLNLQTPIINESQNNLHSPANLILNSTPSVSLSNSLNKKQEQKKEILPPSPDAKSLGRRFSITQLND